MQIVTIHAPASHPIGETRKKPLSAEAYYRQVFTLCGRWQEAGISNRLPENAPTRLCASCKQRLDYETKLEGNIHARTINCES